MCSARTPDGNQDLQSKQRTLTRVKKLLVSDLGGGCYILHKFRIFNFNFLSSKWKIVNRKEILKIQYMRQNSSSVHT